MHDKGEHSKGSLIHDNTSGVLVYRNVYASNRERNALFKGGAQGAMVNNLIFNPGTRATHYNLWAGEWAGKPYQVGRVALVGNVLRHGPDTVPHTPLFTLRGDADVDLFLQDNIATDRSGRTVPPTANLSSDARADPRGGRIRPAGRRARPARFAARGRADQGRGRTTLGPRRHRHPPAARAGRRPRPHHRFGSGERARLPETRTEPPPPSTSASGTCVDMSPKAGWSDIGRLTLPQP